MTEPHIRDRFPHVGNDQPSSSPLQAETTPQSSSSSNPIREFRSLNLENKGSVARDHMANERTFLAWLRTSLSLVTIGIGVTQLFRLEKPKNVRVSMYGDQFIDLSNEDRLPQTITKYGKPLGSIFIIMGILALLFGMDRYFRVQYLLTKNQYPATRLGILVLVGVIFVVISVAFYMIIESS